MKKLSLLLVFALLSISTFAQRNWAVEGGVGLHTIADECADLRDNLYHIDGVVRYSFNEKFGVGAYGGYDRLSLEDFRTKEEANTNYFRLNLEGIADVTEITGLGNNVFTLLAHGGPGASYFSVDNGYSNTIPNVSGGLTGLFKLSKRFAVKADWTTTGHFNQGRTLNGNHAVTNVGINSFINNATVGLAFYFGRSKDNSGEHYDWWEKHEKDELDRLEDRVSELNRKVNNIQPVTIIENKCCDDTIYSEFVYFDFDKYDIKRSELAAVESAIEKAGKDAKLLITGFACPRFGTDKYNFKLANRRVERVADLAVGMGFPQNRIITEVVGKDIDRNSDNAEVRATARRVELRIIQ